MEIKEIIDRGFISLVGKEKDLYYGEFAFGIHDKNLISNEKYFFVGAIIFDANGLIYHASYKSYIVYEDMNVKIMQPQYIHYNSRVNIKDIFIVDNNNRMYIELVSPAALCKIDFDSTIWCMYEPSSIDIANIRLYQKNIIDKDYFNEIQNKVNTKAYFTSEYEKFIILAKSFNTLANTGHTSDCKKYIFS